MKYYKITIKDAEGKPYAHKKYTKIETQKVESAARKAGLTVEDTEQYDSDSLQYETHARDDKTGKRYSFRYKIFGAVSDFTEEEVAKYIKETLAGKYDATHSGPVRIRQLRDSNTTVNDARTAGPYIDKQIATLIEHLDNHGIKNLRCSRQMYNEFTDQTIITLTNDKLTITAHIFKSSLFADFDTCCDEAIDKAMSNKEKHLGTSKNKYNSWIAVQLPHTWEIDNKVSELADKYDLNDKKQWQKSVKEFEEFIKHGMTRQAKDSKDVYERLDAIVYDVIDKQEFQDLVGHLIKDKQVKRISTASNKNGYANYAKYLVSPIDMCIDIYFNNLDDVIDARLRIAQSVRFDVLVKTDDIMVDTTAI